MQIGNIFGGQPDPGKISKRTEAVEAMAGRAKAAAAAVAGPGGGKPALGEILAKYDVTHISPSDFSDMIQKLYKAGSISESDYQELAGIRVDLEAAGVKSDEQINLREFYAGKIQQLQREAAGGQDDGTSQQQLATATRRRDWVEKFALVQANPASAGIDAVA
jgi:hypothetical protein